MGKVLLDVQEKENYRGKKVIDVKFEVKEEKTTAGTATDPSLSTFAGIVYSPPISRLVARTTRDPCLAVRRTCERIGSERCLEDNLCAFPTTI